MTHAIVQEETGGPDVLDFRAVAEPVAGPGELVVRHTAIGLNYSDPYFRAGLYPAPNGMPLTVGHEAAGVVEAVGEGVSEFAPGDRIAYAGALGAILMGVGGAILTSYVQLLDPSGYQPINHTFIVWVMIIVGGAGNNYGALFGGIFIYIVWTISEPASVILFSLISDMSEGAGIGAIPDIESRALQMRVFVLGLVITFALRYAPQGMIPERVRTEKE